MKIRVFAILLSIALVLSVSTFALAQTGVDWGIPCLSGDVELSLMEGDSVLVRCLLGAIVETPTPTATEVPTPIATIQPPAGGRIVVDHTSIALFDQIPEQYLTAAREMPMVFGDRSVGVNMNDALDCLTAPSWELSLSRCRRDYTDATQTTIKLYTDFATAPDLIKFSTGPQYNRANWSYVDCSGTWDVMTELFVNTIAPQYLPTKDVLSCQFSYLNVADGSTIDDPVVGYFSTDVEMMENIESQNPDKTFVFWTTSLARIIGTQDATTFNEQMRAYAAENNVVLMDMADIISHDRNGNPCLLNGNPVICRDYTSEISGGHLGSVSGGQIVMAKAFWVLMAQIAGWTP